MSETIRRRREIRMRFEEADSVVEHWDHLARLDNVEQVPPMDAPPENLAASSAAEITVNVLWLAYILDYARDKGRGQAQGGG